MTVRGLKLEPGQPLHATAVAVDGQGVVITGPSGAGKTALGLAIIRRARQANLPATLVGDDQLFVKAVPASGKANGLMLLPPDALSGDVEIRGNDVVPFGMETSGKIHANLWVSLCEKKDAERYQRDEMLQVNGVRIPHRAIWYGDREHAVTIVLTALGYPAWF